MDLNIKDVAGKVPYIMCLVRASLFNIISSSTSFPIIYTLRLMNPMYFWHLDLQTRLDYGDRYSKPSPSPESYSHGF
jgi:hypothetical protein